jgi:hypothetical protein
MVEATTPRWTFEGGMREAAWEVLALLRHEAEEQMGQSQYRHFPRTLRAMLLALGYSEPPLFVGVPRLLHGNSYLWRVRVIIYERPTTDHIHRIHHVVEATIPRWTFEGGMREDAREALALLRHEAEEQIGQSRYRHFPSHAREGAEAVVMPAGDRDDIGCFADQVKLTRALVWDLDEAVKEVNLLGEHQEESSQKIIELEALCKRLREDIHKLKEEKTTLAGMIQSRDELILEMAEEYGLNRMGENDDDEDEDDDDEGNAITPPAPVPAAMPEEIIEEEAPMENGPQELDDLDDLGGLDDDPNEGSSNMDEWFPQDGSNDRDWVIESNSLSLGLRISF